MFTNRALTESLSTPMAASTAAPRGSAAARPHTDTLMPWRRAAATVRSQRASTAGWSASWRLSSDPLVRSAAMAYWVRSFVPIEKKSTWGATASAVRASEGTSTIAPTGGKA